jgi:hypothetical protein
MSFIGLKLLWVRCVQLYKRKRGLLGTLRRSSNLYIRTMTCACYGARLHGAGHVLRKVKTRISRVGKVAINPSALKTSNHNTERSQRQRIFYRRQRNRADFSSTEPHLDPPILLPTVLGVVRSNRQCISVSFDQRRYNALSLQLFGDCLRTLRRNYGIRSGSTVIIGEAEQNKTSILVG